MTVGWPKLRRGAQLQTIEKTSVTRTIAELLQLSETPPENSQLIHPVASLQCAIAMLLLATGSQTHGGMRRGESQPALPRLAPAAPKFAAIVLRGAKEG